MKIEEKHIDYIQKQFVKMQTKEDFLQLLNEVNRFLYREYPTISLDCLIYYSNPIVCKKRYKTFTIQKKSGKKRTINAPTKDLKTILRTLNIIIQCMYKPHKLAMGFIKGKSIVDNAKIHTNQTYVYNIDLKDFFHSFDKSRVETTFIQALFSLDESKKEIASLMANLCTHPFKVEGKTQNVLPQGSPTSPTITNIICYKLDEKLNNLAKRFGAKYTRYADDITFSSMLNIFKKEAFLKELQQIIKDDSTLQNNEKTIVSPILKINPSKTRLQKNVYRQEVTGLIVNEKVNVRRKYVKQIRMWIYYWEKYGYEKAEQLFENDYGKEKGHVIENRYVKIWNPNLINVLNGKLEYLKMVKGEKDSTYVSLTNRFTKLALKFILDFYEEEKSIEKISENLEFITSNYNNITKNLYNYKHPIISVLKTLTNKKLNNVIQKKHPSNTQNKEIELEIENPFSSEPEQESKNNKGFVAVAGMQKLKDIILLDVINALKHKERYIKYGLTIPNGILLYGPPGCGKTFFAEQMAEEIGFNFYQINPSDIQDSWANGAQQNIKRIFKRARENAPSIIFFDELEALVPNRNRYIETGAVNEFLVQMNNCGDDGVFLIGATNKPNYIDPAILRSGRLDKHFYLPPPDFEARKEMFELYLRNRPIEKGLNYGILANETKNYVSSDIKFLVDEASRKALYVNSKITEEILIKTIKSNNPSISMAELNSYIAIKNKMEGKPQPENKRKIGFY